VTKIALFAGPFLSPDGVKPWEYLNERTEYEVIVFESDPPRFDTSSLDMEVRRLKWPDGRFDLFGYDYFFWRAFRKSRIPSAYLQGLRDVVSEFDIIHTVENYNLFSFQAAFHASRQDVPFVFSAGENIPYPEFQRNPIQLAMKKYVNRRADGIITTTPQAKRALIHEGTEHGKITVVPNSVDTDQFRPLSERVHPDVYREGTTNILFVHHLTEQKGVPYLVEAFRRLSAEQDDIQLTLLGDSSLPDKCQTYVEEASDVVWKEFVPYEKMPSVYNAADVFVLPSVTMVNNEEQFGVALLEAMASGLPNVVTSVGGLSYVASYETSLTVDERDADDLYSALRRLVEQDDLRAELGQNARERAEREFGQDVVVDQLMEFYDGVA
jgi:glycosyltransferase involved in cell wall biosynthesis